MKRISLVLLPLLSLTLEGAVIFYPVIPGQITDNTGGSFLSKIDLDMDGEIDFFTTNNGGSQADIVPTGNNRVLSVVATLPDLGRGISPLLGGESIGAAPFTPNSWNGLADRVNALDNGGSYIYRCSGRGPIGTPPICNSLIPSDSEIRFVGLEFEKDDETHYGWVAISAQLSVLNFVDVRGFAYETEPNKAILAGAVPEPMSIFFLITSLIGGCCRRCR